MNKTKTGWKPFLRFYTKFSIPWWLYGISLLAGLAITEVTLRLTEYAVQVNQGNLYNSVILWYVGLTMLSTVISAARTMAEAYATNRITYRARNVLMGQVLHLPVGDIDAIKPSSVISSVVNEAATTDNLITFAIAQVTSIYSFVRAFIVLYRYNYELSTWLLLLYPLAVFIFWLSGKIRYSTTKAQYETLNRMTSYFSEHIGCTKHVKALQLEDKEIEAGAQVIRKRFWADVRLSLLQTITTFLYALYDRLGLVIVASVGSRQIREGKLEQTGLNECTLYANNNNMYFSELIMGYASIKGTQGSLAAVNEIMSLTPETPDKGDPWQEGEEKDIVLEHVAFGYSADREVLHDITCTLPYGKRIAVIGNNGSGKTTLLRLLQGLYTTDKGTITVAGNTIGQVRLGDLRRRFHCVSQDCQLFSTTVRENITFGIDREVSDEELMAAAKAAQIHDVICALPQGYDTPISDGGAHFSGGQRQRLAIARAFLQDTDYLLLDEAGANLDKQAYGKIWQAFCKKMEGRSILFIAHDLSEIRQADLLLVLNHGHLEAIGTEEALMESSETYRKYLEAMEA